MSDTACLKAMLDFETFVKFSPILFKLRNMERQSSMVLRAIKGYYEKYRDRKSISIDELKTYFHYANPQVDKPEIYEHLFDKIEQASFENAELLTDILRQNVEKHVCSQIGEIASEVVQDIRSTGVEKIEGLIKEYRDIAGHIHDAEHDVCDLNLAELLDLDSAEGLSWSLDFLNRTFGPLKHSVLGHIFARPDAGKTSMAINQGTYWAKLLFKRQSERPVLYLNNEEDIRRIKLRSFGSYLGVSLHWLHTHADEAEVKWQEYGGATHYKCIGDVHHVDQVKRYLDAFNPRVVIIDQGPKLDCPGDLDGVARLAKIYNTLRALAGEYETSIITLGQADNNAENKKWLHLNNLDSSKVAIPGELDFCVGIGKVNDEGMEYVRFLNICKNKLLGLYGQDEVTFDIATSRFKDLKTEE